MTNSTPQPVYFSVSNSKFIVMSIMTLGVYDVYWFYQNWKRVQSHSGENISLFWRVLFSNFYFYSLIKRMNASAREVGIRESLNPTWLTLVFLVLTLTGLCPSPYLYLGLLAFLPLYPAQSLISRINLHHNPNLIPNNRYSGKNILGILGILAFAILTYWFMTRVFPDMLIQFREMVMSNGILLPNRMLNSIYDV